MTCEIGTLKELNVQTGDVVECVTSRRKQWWTVGNRYTCLPDCGARDEEGQANWNCAGSTFRIVSRATPPVDLTAITTPFGLLDPATQEALRAHGGPYEHYIGSGWRPTTESQWYEDTVYRVKPAPARETVTHDMGITTYGGVYPAGDPEDTPVRVTFDRVDGVIDLSTYRLEARS